MRVARTRRELDDARPGLASPCVLVPTMGALHDGHVSLLATARACGGSTVASIFVNPLQFDAAADLARYPRDETGDLAMLERVGCDLVWLPRQDEMYPDGDATFVDVGGPAIGWEGSARPGHFRGVATVVSKLFGQVRPDAACFGEKDWQQLQVVRRMTADLALGVEVRAVPTRRETDGLAMSSRNRFLLPAERFLAPGLHAALAATAASLRAGNAPGPTLERARGRLADDGFAVEYLALVEGATMREAAGISATTRLIAAARLGQVRLLDNIATV